jgi:hypothetical protein
MDAVALLRRAQQVGLRVETAGDKLLVRGPKRAEPVVKLLAEHKLEVLAALAPAPSSKSTDKGEDAADATEVCCWRERFTARTFEWFNGERDWEAAKRLAWGDLENEWHHRRGKRRPAWQCAGCERPIGGIEALNLPDGNRVHFEPIDCLLRFGRRWRSEARAALIALGLDPPLMEIRYD